MMEPHLQKISPLPLNSPTSSSSEDLDSESSDSEPQLTWKLPARMVGLQVKICLAKDY